METTLIALARELELAAVEMPARAAAVVAKGLLNIKSDARRNAEQTSGAHAAKYPETITYGVDAGGLSGEVGPERKGQGNLGPILENGSRNNPPHRDLGRALDSEEPRFIAEAVKLAIPWG